MGARANSSSALAVVAVLFASMASPSPAQNYMLQCMGCHGPSAEGVPGKVPPLAKTLVQFMRIPEGRNYVLRVPGAANSMLTDQQLAEVLNWIAQRFAGAVLLSDGELFSAQEVTALRHTPLASVQATRREVLKELAATGSAPSTDY
jgi:mono/diheme cytochrome c family protein